MTAEPSSLKILIAGAGIGGLATALGLRREGHDVQVFEKSSFSNEAGAALTVPPNVDGLLKRMGLDPMDYGGTIEGEIVSEVDFSKFRKFFTPNEAGTIHRVDLHQGLKDLALSSGVKLDLQNAVASIDPQTGSLTLDNGTVQVGDVVIGADGIHSRVRQSIFSEAKDPHPFGVFTFRFVVPSSRITEDAVAKKFVEKDGHLTVWDDRGGRKFITYPCRNNEMVNAVATVPESLALPDPEDSDLKGIMLKLFSDFSPQVEALMMLADKVMTWRLFDIPTLPTWSSGKAILIGDAAHPLQPYSAQGGAQAIEDAATLTVLLHNGTKPTQVPRRLQLFHQCRQQRVNLIQAFSRSMGQSQPGKHVEPLMPYADYNQIVFRHDAWAHAEQALAYEENKVRWIGLKVLAALRFLRKGVGIAVASIQGK